MYYKIAFLKRDARRTGSQQWHHVLRRFYPEFWFSAFFLSIRPWASSPTPEHPSQAPPLSALQAPSQFLDYNLQQFRNPVSQVGFGMEERRHQASALCSAALYVHTDGHIQCSQLIPFLFSGWGCQPQKANIPVYTGSWTSVSSAWSMLSNTDKGIIDALKASMKTSCT